MGEAESLLGGQVISVDGGFRFRWSDGVETSQTWDSMTGAVLQAAHEVGGDVVEQVNTLLKRSW